MQDLLCVYNVAHRRNLTITSRSCAPLLLAFATKEALGECAPSLLWYSQTLSNCPLRTAAAPPCVIIHIYTPTKTRMGHLVEKCHLLPFSLINHQTPSLSRRYCTDHHIHYTTVYTVQYTYIYEYKQFSFSHSKEWHERTSLSTTSIMLSTTQYEPNHPLLPCSARFCFGDWMRPQYTIFNQMVKWSNA